MAVVGDARVTGWALSLDESGDFADPAQPACVAGLLLREAPTREADAILRGALERIDPLVRYPPHATELRQPAWWVAAWVLAPPELRVAHPRRGALDEAAMRCEAAAADPALAAMWEALRRGHRPTYRALALASAWMERNLPRVASLRALAHDVARRYLETAAALGAAYSPGGCSLLAACDPGGAPPALDAPDRYLALLVVLFERVFALLRARPPERHQVWVTAAQRDVRDPVLGARPLRAQDVGDCVRRAERFPLDPPDAPADPWVRLVPTMPVAYDERVPPGVALADFLANRCRRALADGTTWPSVRDELTRVTGLPCEVVPRCAPGGDPMPTVAASGAARDLLARAFAGDAPTAPEPDGRWPLEQAARWARVAAALRAGVAR